METEELVSIFEAVKVVTLRPGDILVFRCKEVLTDEQRKIVSLRLKDAFGATKMAFLEGGADICAIRPEA